MALLLLFTLVALVSAVVGIWLTGFPALARRTLPFSGGVLVGIAAFWVLPELAVSSGWAIGGAWLAAGFVLLWLVDHYVYPVCPACSHSHDHEACQTRLHGFAPPMLLAATLHSLLDGWSISASGQASGDLATAILAGIALHKVPEGLALGVILRAALPSRGAALLGCAAVQSATIAGGAIEIGLSGWLRPEWISGLLALAGGSFLYLGSHAVHGEWRRRGAPAFLPALTGAASAVALERGVRLLLR